MEEGLLDTEMAVNGEGESINQPFPSEWKVLLPTPKVE